jgi:helix-turn-helix protein
LHRPKSAAKLGQPHVRLYAWELDLPAYRTLSVDARALLVELRSLYSGGRNEVFMSVRTMQERLGIGQRRAQRARDALLQRGWIRILAAGAFHRKTKVATVFALNNEPLSDRDGAVPPKDYVRWKPDNFTVAGAATHGSHGSYSVSRRSSKALSDGSRRGYRERPRAELTVADAATQISYQAERSVVAPLLWAFGLCVDDSARLKVLIWHLALTVQEEQLDL